MTENISKVLLDMAENKADYDLQFNQVLIVPHVQQINCDTNKDFCNKLSPSKYPSIFYSREFVYEFSLSFNPDTFLKWIVGMQRPVIFKVKNELELSEFK
jgi:hypothetical protein